MKPSPLSVHKSMKKRILSTNVESFRLTLCEPRIGYLVDIQLFMRGYRTILYWFGVSFYLKVGQNVFYFGLFMSGLLQIFDFESNNYKSLFELNNL